MERKYSNKFNGRSVFLGLAIIAQFLNIYNLKSQVVIDGIDSSRVVPFAFINEVDIDALSRSLHFNENGSFLAAYDLFDHRVSVLIAKLKKCYRLYYDSDSLLFDTVCSYPVKLFFITEHESGIGYDSLILDVQSGQEVHFVEDWIAFYDVNNDGFPEMYIIFDVNYGEFQGLQCCCIDFATMSNLSVFYQSGTGDLSKCQILNDNGLPNEMKDFAVKWMKTCLYMDQLQFDVIAPLRTTY